MGVRNASSATTAFITTNVPNATDTLLLTTGNIGLVQDNAQINVFWYLVLQVGAAAATVTIRIRRGATITSTVINVVAAQSVVAATQNVHSGCYVDTPGVLGQVQYSLSATIGGGAANGTAGDGCLAVMCL